MLRDFYGKYIFVVQDEEQSFLYDNIVCPIRFVAKYYKADDGPLSHVPYVFISDDNTHDVDFIYKLTVTNDIRTILPIILRSHTFLQIYMQVSTISKSNFPICANFNMS